MVTPQFGFNDTVLRTVGLESWHGPGEISIYGEARWLKEWASRKDRCHAPVASKDAPNDLGFQMALEKQLHQQTCMEHAFPAEDELGVLDDPDIPEPPPGQAQEQQSRLHEISFGIRGSQNLNQYPVWYMSKLSMQLPHCNPCCSWQLEPLLPSLTFILWQVWKCYFFQHLSFLIKHPFNFSWTCNLLARTFRCEGCDAVHPKPQTQKVTLPRSLSFNDSVQVDIFEVKDANGERYSVFSMVDQGTCFHQATVIKVGGSQATSRECLKAVQNSWMSWAGAPREVVSDRGLHNRGELASMGRQITLE